MQVKIGIGFHRAEMIYLEISRLYTYIKKIICEGTQFYKSL